MNSIGAIGTAWTWRISVPSGGATSAAWLVVIRFARVRSVARQPANDTLRCPTRALSTTALGVRCRPGRSWATELASRPAGSQQTGLLRLPPPRRSGYHRRHSQQWIWRQADGG